MKYFHPREAFNSSITVIAVLVIYSALALSCCYYERLTGDSTLYLSIAEKYIHGDFKNAVNGYWGPLLSWLLVPLLSFGASHVFAINALNLMFGLLTIAGFWRLTYCFELNENVRTIMLIALAPILLFISLIEPMDFLLLCVLIYYFLIVYSKSYPDKLSSGAMSGIMGALAYFSKPFGLPFFLSHFILFNTLHYFGSSSELQKKNILRNALLGLILFSLLSGIWIGLLSSKYGRFTITNQGRGVFASLGPGSTHKTLEKGDPIFFEGFFPPPNESAIVIYEDPTYARKKVWNPLESRSFFKHYIANLTENVVQVIRIYESYSRFSIAIIVSTILLILFYFPGKLLSRRELIFPLFTILLYTAGYMPFHFEARYLWIVNILLLLMGGVVLNELFKREFFSKAILRHTLAVLFTLSFMITPIKSVVQINKDGINTEMHTLAMELTDLHDLRGNFASNRKKTEIPSYDSWHHTFRLAYWLNSRYYGMPREEISDELLAHELKKFDIDYYFYWDDNDSIPSFLTKYSEVTSGEVPGLKIFSLKDKKS